MLAAGAAVFLGNVVQSGGPAASFLRIAHPGVCSVRMGNSDRAIALPLGGDGLPAAVCRRGCAPADSQSLTGEYQRRVAGGDEPHTDRIAGDNGGLQPVAGTALA